MPELTGPQHRIKFPTLEETRKYWHGRTQPPEEEPSLETKGLKKTRKQWLEAISSPDWLNLKPQLRERANADSPLIRMLVADHGYCEKYIRYLTVQHREPSTQLLEELMRRGYRYVADEIYEGVLCNEQNQ
jgi:hypothetical protein